jgi:tetratricopeptide (TPR) repeat protein
MLGALYERQGQWEKAIAAFEQAALRDAGSATAYRSLGALYERTGRIGRAVRALERALEIDPGAAAAGADLERLRKQGSGSR